MLFFTKSTPIFVRCLLRRSFVFECRGATLSMRENRAMKMIIRNFYLLLYTFNRLDGINYKHDNIDGLLNV